MFFISLTALLQPAPLPIPDNEDNNNIECDKCRIEILRKEYRYHLRTNLHKSNCLLKTEFDNIDIITTAFKKRIVTYRLNPSQNFEYITPETFLSDNKSNILHLFSISLKKHNCIKVNFELFVYFNLPKSNEKHLNSFITKYESVYQSTDLNELFNNLNEYLKTKVEEMQYCDSGWTIINISHLEININKYCPLRGGTYIDLPLSIKNTKSCINIQNNDNHCFLWCIIAALFPSKSNVCRVKSYPHYLSILNIKGMSFPPSFTDIRLFEKNNPDISINVYGLDNKCCVNGPLYLTKNRRIDHVNLLYFERDNKEHYCLIKDLTRLVRRQITHHNGKIHLCESCLQFFNDKLNLRSHKCNKILEVLPEKDSFIKFKHYERQQKINFVIYADFECLLLNFKEQKSENTKTLKKHQPSCFGYYICCSHNQDLNKYVSYRGTDCVQVFIQSLIHDAKLIHQILSDKKTMQPLTLDQETQYQNATVCHICNELLFDDKVRDHDHITSIFRGAAHSHCNLMHRVCSFIPVIFHNLSGYDAHLFIEELMKYEGTVRIIPKSKEKYLSITKVIESTKGLRSFETKFIDSFQFLSSSLDMLSKSLSENDFNHL